MPKILLVHPGTQYSQHLAKQLHKRGLLYLYYTGFVISGNGLSGFLYRLLPGVFKKKLVNRVLSDIPSKKIKSKPLIEFAALYKIARGRDSETVLFGRNRQFQVSISDDLLKSADIVIGFDTSSWILAKRCKELGIKFILDVSIGHPMAKERIFADLLAKYPTWVRQIAPKQRQLIDLEIEEAEMSDWLVVPSRFVRRTYIENGSREEKIKVNPFGTELKTFLPKTYEKQMHGIKFLFFGGLTARKGLPILLEVWLKIIEHYNNVELTIAGFGIIPEGVSLPNSVRNLGTIKGDDRVALYHSADVFVFPSFFEGFAQVQVEAAACGLPVITTSNAGGEEIVSENEGILITPGNFEELYNAMIFFIDNPENCKIFGRNAREKALKCFTWDAYGERWNKIIQNITS